MKWGGNVVADIPIGDLDYGICRPRRANVGVVKITNAIHRQRRCRWVGGSEVRDITEDRRPILSRGGEEV